MLRPRSSVTALIILFLFLVLPPFLWSFSFPVATLNIYSLWSCLTSPTICSQKLEYQCWISCLDTLATYSGRGISQPAVLISPSLFPMYVPQSTHPLQNSPQSILLFLSVSLFLSPTVSFLLEPCGITESLTRGGTWIIPALPISL